MPPTQGGKDCSRAPLPGVATSSDGGERHFALALVPLTIEEEQAARQVYDAHRIQLRKIRHHTKHARATQRRSQITKTASPSPLSRGAAVGERELLRLLRRLYQSAQAMMASSAHTTTSRPRPPQRRAASLTKAANAAGAPRALTSNEYLLGLAEVCFGARRFQTLMTAATADGDVPVPFPVGNEDQDAPALSAASHSRLSSPSIGLTIGETLSFFCCLTSGLAASALEEGQPRHAGHIARLGAKTASLQPRRDLTPSQRRRSASASTRQSALQVCRLRSALAARRQSRPPPSSLARIVARPAAPTSPSPSRAEMSGAAALIRPRKPHGRGKGLRSRTAALPPPSPNLFSSDSYESDATYKGDPILMYVQRRAFAEIAEGQGSRDSSTVTLVRLAKVLRWFNIALNPSAVERVCGVPMRSSPESPISIDFDAFVKIIDSGLHAPCCSEGSCSSFASTLASAGNAGDSQTDVLALDLLPEPPLWAAPVLPLIPGWTAATAASFSAGRGVAPCARSTCSISPVRDSEGSNRSLLAAASVASASHPRQSSLSSVAPTTSSAESGARVRRSSLDTDDAYPFVARDSAMAVLCRSIRQRLRRELRRSVSSGSEALLPLRDGQSSANWSDVGTAPKEEDYPQPSPFTQRTTAVSYSSRSSSPSTAPASMLSGDVTAAGLRRGSGLVSMRHSSEASSTPPTSSKGRSGTTCNTQLLRQRLRKQVSQSRAVAPALPPRSYAYTKTPALRSVRAHPDSSGEEVIVSQCPITARRWRGRQLSGPPPAGRETARRLPPSTGAVGRCRQLQRSTHLLTSLSPYSSTDHDLRATGGHHRLRSAALSAQGRMRRSLSLKPFPGQSALYALPAAEPDSFASLLFQPAPPQTTSRRPKLSRPRSCSTRPAAARTLGGCVARVSHPPFSQSARSSPLPWSREASQGPLEGRRLSSR
ncbi:hypothetical protein LSCM1_00215 [Leishmania martiniquensis]|uniref:Streptococcal hemagglutinin-like protein n=1 Tax=Leishmania martiniquensis TaxID=1580590 RepID=A0A836GSR8_9TRYP|nr:hypothetical protein LSCM1_00215 [Leishmania martiniquensis]